MTARHIHFSSSHTSAMATQWRALFACVHDVLNFAAAAISCSKAAMVVPNMVNSPAPAAAAARSPLPPPLNSAPPCIIVCTADPERAGDWRHRQRVVRQLPALSEALTQQQVAHCLWPVVVTLLHDPVAAVRCGRRAPGCGSVCGSAGRSVLPASCMMCMHMSVSVFVGVVRRACLLTCVCRYACMCPKGEIGRRPLM
jgi:hypothetical protein